jgi:recombination protein RecA
MGLIDKRGSYYSYGDQRIAQGRENARAYLREDGELAEELERRLRVQAGLIEGEAAEEGVAEESAEEATGEPDKVKAVQEA